MDDKNLKSETHAADQAAQARGEGGSPPQVLPPLDFSTFVLSLSTSALMNLGLVENPVTKKIEKEMPMARQTIDLLALLQEKTKGNLTKEEAKLLEDVLHELRVWYCKADI
ncbi:MAG: DUF1844 domain-containing protein [Deltaproteobacteria bacterium]|nr:DUF1844 domain-containing protein [Deltaproteobacteria bacterium]